MAKATWIGTVTLRDTRRWHRPEIVKLEASNARLAVKDAAAAALAGLPKGTRVQGICVKLERVAAREPRHVTTDACRSNGCPKCREQADRDHEEAQS